jgi:ATP-binding protein involved in chromosome partitioning
MESLKNIKSVVAVGSCKGGVGKTTVAVNIAMALRRTGFNVGLFDADLYGPNVPLMLGLRSEGSYAPFSLRNPVTGEHTNYIPLYNRDDRRYIEPTRRFGIYVMSLGLWFSEQDVARDSSFLGGQLVTQVLSNVNWPDLDFLIIDLPPSTDQLLQLIVARSSIDGILLVTTPQDLTLLDAGRSLKLFNDLGVSVLGRVENMSFLMCPGCSERIEIYSTGYEDWDVLQKLPLLGEVPLDPRYAKPVDAYHPFTQVDVRTPATQPFLDIAESVRVSLAQ